MNQRRRPWEMPRLWAWDLEHHGNGPRASVGGVSDDRHLVVISLHDALADAPPGSHGVVRRVELSRSGRITYDDLGVIADAWHDEASGAVVWAQRSEVGLDALFALERAVIEAMPPDQLTAWWADFQDRRQARPEAGW